MNPVYGLLQASGGGPGLAVFALQIGAFIAIFWFLLIRPQRKEQQRHQEMLQTLKKGDEIVTNGGVVGKIVKADETNLTVKSGNAEFIVERLRVARKLGAEPTP
jgi:preprotein translocase subunit YajC